MIRRCAALLVAIGALAAPAATASAAPPLIGQWPLDGSYEDGASQVTPDVSGGGLGLRAPNGAMHLGTPARFGTGATLATNVTPLQVTSPALAPAQMTLLAWVRQTGNPGTLRYIAGRGDDGLTCGGSTFALYTGYPGKPGLHFYVRSGPAGAATFSAPAADAAVFNGQWHLVAGTYDGTAVQLYVDGVPAGAATPAAAPLRYGLGGGSSLYVDGYAVEGCALSPNADDWPGAVDEVRLYDRALSAGELGRLAAAGPAAPDLITDASLVPPPPPPPIPAPSIPPGGAGVVPIPAPPPAKALEAAAAAKAAASVEGATKQRVSAASAAALTAAQAQAVEAMKAATDRSKVSAAKVAREISAREARRTKPDPRVQARLETMEYGIAAKIPAAPGEVVEAVATIALEKKQKTGKVAIQTIMLAPAVGIAGAGKQAEVQFPVDAKAAAAMQRNDIARAAISVQAANLGGVADMGETESLRLQMAMDRVTKSMSTLDNLLDKIRDVQSAIAKNLKGGVSGAERKDQHQLESKENALQRQASSAEDARDRANEAAAESAKARVAALDAVQAAMALLSGCRCPTI